MPIKNRNSIKPEAQDMYLLREVTNMCPNRNSVNIDRGVQKGPTTQTVEQKHE